jgi:bacillithiol biosynthesis cysteine-adding enzyme BshC
LTVDLVSAGLLPPLPAAFITGEDRDLLAPLRFLPPGEMPAGPPPRVERRALARALEVANRAYGHPRAAELGARLADPETRVVVAGQQPGLFGGPLYTLSKMAAAVRWAEELERAGTPAVAVFWVATEDHDYDEVARVGLPTRDGFRTFGLGSDPEPLVPVGMRTLGLGLAGIYEELREAFAGDRLASWLSQLERWYRPDARFGEAFCRFMVHLLRERSPLLLDALLPEVKAAERPFLVRLVEQREEVEQALAAADEAVAARGYPLQVNPQRGTSPLFLLQRGERRRIEWVGADGFRARGTDEVGTVPELLERLADNPAVVSPGVLARPAIQDAILGTALQVMGPGEVSYLAQAAAVYRVLPVTAPMVALRPQALVLEGHLADKLEQVGLSLPVVLGDAAALEGVLAERAGGDPVTVVRERVVGALAELEAPLTALDPTLARPWQKTRDQVLGGLDLLSAKAVAALARKNETQARRVEQVRTAALPGGRLQERAVAVAHFAAKYPETFAASFLDQLSLDPRVLQVIRP